MYERVVLELAPTIKLGTNTQASLKAFTADGTVADVSADASWSSTAENIATVGAGGLITAIALGETAITATYQSLTASLNLSVLSADDQVIALLISPDSPNIAVGSTQIFTANAVYNSGTQRDVTASAVWTSANPNLLRVDQPGRVTALAEGQASLAVSYDGAQGQTSVTAVAQGGSGTMSNLDVADVVSRLSQARCLYDYRCRSTRFFIFNWLDLSDWERRGSYSSRDRDLEICKTWSSANMSSFFSVMDGAIQDNRVRFDPAVLESCIESFRNIGCGDQPPSEICKEAFTGLQAYDEGCQFTVECSASNFCLGGPDICGGCTQKFLAGEECFGFEDECVDGTECVSVSDTETSVCVPVRQDGESCGTVSTGVCADGMTCAYYSENADTGYCNYNVTSRGTVQLGERCYSTFTRDPRFKCDQFNNLVCLDDPVGDGETCQEFQWAHGLTRDGDGDWLTTDEDGDACRRQACLPQFSVQDFTSGANRRCFCRAYRGLGGPCALDPSSPEDKCLGILQCAGGVCQEKSDLGEACFLPSDCKMPLICGLNYTCERLTYQQCL